MGPPARPMTPPPSSVKSGKEITPLTGGWCAACAAASGLLGKTVEPGPNHVHDERQLK